jgi:hypothetical protein
VSHDPTEVVTEFFIDNAWRSTYDGEDLAARVRGRDAIRLTVGGADQFSSITSRASSFTLNNGDNLFTDDDPNSPLYHKFGQSTRVRHSVQHPTLGYDLYAKVMDMPVEPSGARIHTGDKASLDITGDIDVRWEIDMRNTRDLSQVIVAKYELVSDERSWVVYTNTSGQIILRHTTAGTFASSVTALSPAGMIPETEGRLAYRVTLDVDNGAGGKTWTWYTSDSIDGTWTQVGTETTAGTTSIYAGTAEISIGAGGDGDNIISDVYPFRGRLYSVQVRNGIGGTLVADFDPNSHASLGDDTWSDTCSTPNTWVIGPGTTDLTAVAIRLASDRIRGTLEIQTRPDDWDLSGVDRWCAMTAQGSLSRYASTRAPLRATVTRHFMRQPNVVGFWPCSDGSEATTVGSLLDGGVSGTINECSFTSIDEFDGASGAVELNEAGVSTALFRASAHTASGVWGVLFYFNVDELPASTSVVCNIYPKGSTIQRWVISVSLTGFDFQGYDYAGSVATSAGVNYGDGVDPSLGAVAMFMNFSQEGGNIRWETAWHQVGSTDTYVHASGGSTVAGTVGAVDRMFVVPTNASLNNLRISEVVMFNAEYQITSEFGEISRGYAQETFGARWLRLLTEEGITAEWAGDLSLTEECGPQLDTSLYQILEEGAKLDGGLVTEARDLPLSWRYVTGASLGNRRRSELSYSGSEIADVPRPVGDGRYLVNDFTASRERGASARYEATDARRKNVREPDDTVSPGVGRVERSDSYNAYEDARMWYLASNRVHLGTWDERHVPTMSVALHRTQIENTPALLAGLLSQDVGDPIAIIDTAGSPLPPNNLRSVCTGYTETIDNLTHLIVFNTVPQGPYDVPIIESGVADYVPILGADEGDSESFIKSALNTTATSFIVATIATATVPFWVDDAGYPDDIGGGETLDIDIGGERITATSITAPSLVSGYNEQTFTVTRSTNGIVKAHDALAPVRLFVSSYLGRI